ncbi:hypothetical protein ILYODFUR_014847 [Ilyodon furcidens]|uniref:Uncharacterized protein n=1 Tax=Ilyodon furcidens TaxID=33524 RepID=A0ABV0TVX2_9TELE
MRETSCGPYLSRPVMLILPWPFGCQEEQAGRQSGSGGVQYWDGVPSQGTRGPWETQSSANSWIGVGSKVQGSATLNFAKDKQNVLLDQCFFVLFVSLLCSLKPPVGRGRWPLTLSLVLVLLEVSSC